MVESAKDTFSFKVAQKPLFVNFDGENALIATAFPYDYGTNHKNTFFKMAEHLSGKVRGIRRCDCD